MPANQTAAARRSSGNFLALATKYGVYVIFLLCLLYTSDAADD